MKNFKQHTNNSLSRHSSSKHSPSGKIRPKAKKQLGQNFLVNQNIVDRIVETAELGGEDAAELSTEKASTDLVVEIGPGLGILTQALARKAHHVRSIELDRDLLPGLQIMASQHPNLEIIHADALKIALPHEPYKVVANIPYYITSPLLNHFLQPKTPDEKSPAELRPSLLVLMVQKEVAEKVCAKPGDHSVLSLQVQVFGEPKLVMIVGRKNFAPRPKVDSAILKIKVYPKPLIDNTEIFFKLIHAAFSQKRKTLLNSLQHGLQLPKENIVALLAKAGISENERPQKLTMEQWGKMVDIGTNDDIYN